MSYSNQPCRKCGATGQGNVEFNVDTNQWVFHCLLCAADTLIPQELIPPELHAQRYRYSEHVLQSSNVFQGSGRPKYNNRSE